MITFDGCIRCHFAANEAPILTVVRITKWGRTSSSVCKKCYEEEKADWDKNDWEVLDEH